MSSIARMMPSRYLFAVFAAALVFFVASGTLGGYDGASYAQAADPGAPIAGGTPSDSNLETSGPEGQRRSCSTIEQAKGGVFLGRIVPCLVKTIEHGASRMSREMIELLRPALYAFLTFIMVIFGVQILQNEGQLQTRAFVLLLKIGFCFTILAAIPGSEETNEGGLIGAAYSIMDEGQAIVLSVLGPEGQNIHCQIERFGDANTPLIWKHMDCLVSKLWGFTVGSPGPSGEARPNMLLASSIVGMLGGFFFGGSFGVALFFACIGMLISMFVLVLRIIVALLNSYFFIAIYMIMSPLLLPLMFLKVTNYMFEKWYNGILAAILLPVIVTAYAVLALQVYDKLFFADNSRLTQLFDNQLMDQARRLPRQACDSSISNNTQFRAISSGMTEQQIYTNNPMFQGLNLLGNTANNLCLGAQVPNLDLSGLTDSNGQPMTAREAFVKLFQDVVQILILTMLLVKGFSTLMSAVRPMIGSAGVVGAIDLTTPTERKFKSALEEAKGNFQSTITRDPDTGRQDNAAGTAFLSRIGPAFQASGRGFLSGMGLEMANTPPNRGGGGGAAGGAAGGSRPQAPGNTGGAGSTGGAAGAGGGGDDGPDNTGSGGSTPRPGAGGARGGTDGGRATIRNASPAERREAAERILGGADAQRFAELEDMLERGGLPEDRRDEYERLLDRIDQAG